MPKSNQLVINLLNELHKGDFKITFESLGVLLDYLETKNDPSPRELQIINSIYQFIEKVNILESSLRIYTSDNSQRLLGSKLTNLYENSILHGTQKLFE
jgi:hypothetical protein